jgi:acetyl-CoA acyltransferase 2
MTCFIANQADALYIVDGLRTPFGKYGGALTQIHPVELAVLSAKSLLNNLKLNPDKIDQVIFSNVIPATPDCLYAARHLALKLGCLETIPALNLNRLCGSGIEAIVTAARLIANQEASAILCSGAENMSMIPHLVYGGRFGVKYGELKSRDFLLETLSDTFTGLSMGITAENLAEQNQITLEDCNQFAFDSHKKASQAWNSHKFSSEVVPVNLGKINLLRDEHLREDIDLTSMKKLKASFKTDGVVNPANASGIVDGAATCLIASASFCKQHNLKPKAKIIAGSVVGVDPKIMGIGPVPAIIELLQKTKFKIEDIDLFEINEAFAAQALACQKQLAIPSDKLNIWGGAVGLGHPLGATGIRLAITLANQLIDTSRKRGIASACIGGGQGIALMVEKN